MSRVAKTDPRLVAYADVDETNSVLGVALALGRPGARGRRAAAQHPERPVRRRRRPLHPDHPRPGVPAAADHRRLHRAAGGGLRRAQRGAADADQLHPARAAPPAAALLHQARVVARRAERSVWALLAADAERTNPETARYLNRLSDLLFILAREANPGGDILWEPGGHSGGARPAGRLGAAGRAAADSTQERKPVTVELSIASSRGPSGVGAWSGRRRPTGSATSSRPGLRRASTCELGAATAAPAGAPTATARGTRAACRRRTRRHRPTTGATGRAQPHGDRAEAGEQEATAQQERDDDDDEAEHRAGRAGPWSRASGGRRRVSGSAVAQASSPAARSRDWARRAASSASGSSEPLGPAQRLAGAGDVDLGRDLRGLGEDGHPPLGDRQEAAVRRDDDVLAGVGADRHDAALGELAEQRRVTGQYTRARPRWCGR